MAFLFKTTRRLQLLNRTFHTTTTTMAPPIKLHTAGTPNGKKISVFLEELKAAYNTDIYEYQKIDMSKTEQKEPWYIALNPNGRIPTIVDRANDDFVVFETGAILLYLQEKYDPDNKFGFSGSKEKSEVLQWLFWANAGLGPMMGQAGHFLSASEQIPYAQKRYIDETKRLFGVLQIRLKDREWLVGDKYSIADINAYTWVSGHAWLKIESLDEWPDFKKWVERIKAREAVKKGTTIP
ncbi:Glutathione S-transferase C-terminal-like protein [Mycena indigotica]|uniref:Glutathione S-transferase C-terminal-like protein n=1 Tax=Mycena indigotica TaxID=2126181 RepID=A0A8H6W103_9AGAR|nr:Glutathione S-transferase C-terminal-like protein [Mycena indigotica]KAF7299056.1 Glutathione S-transferase C-terminal-like protein [Mycena indigotica]